MSFLRHREIYQVSEPTFGVRPWLERARPRGHALTHRLDESPVGYSWRVALQQSPLPLHQPVPTLQHWRGELQEPDRCNLDPTLTCGLTLGAHPKASGAQCRLDIKNPPIALLDAALISVNRITSKPTHSQRGVKSPTTTRDTRSPTTASTTRSLHSRCAQNI